MTLIHDLGQDADLLVRKDTWLEQQRRETAAELDKLANELRSILLAQRIKSTLQQTNMVAVLENSRDDRGDIQDIDIKIQHLPSILSTFDRDKHDPHKRISALAQTTGWKSDGYDIEGSRALRPAS